MARKKHKKRGRRLFTLAPSCFVFTSATIKIARRALKIMGQPLGRRANPQESKVVFAVEAIKQIESKLDALDTSCGPVPLISFDYNETLILVTAIQMYCVDLSFLPPGPKRARETQQCKQMIAHFGADLERGGEKTP